jgi:hypothetical protein
MIDQQEPRYRDVTPKDIDKAIQVRDNDKDDWVDCSLLQIIKRGQYSADGLQWFSIYVCNLGQAWAQARIVDGGEA